MPDFYLGVPFSGIEKEVDQIDLITTREDESIGIAVGMKLAGKDPLVFMQDSGIGNSLDIITSLLIPYEISINLLIAQRTSPEHHRAMGEKSDLLLRTVRYDTFKYC